MLAIPAAVLGCRRPGRALTAFVATQEDDHSFALIMRFLTLPMFLFSGTFFPLSQLPALLRPIAWVLPLWHSVELCRDATTGTLGAGGWLAVCSATWPCSAPTWRSAGGLGLRTFHGRLAP